MAPSEFEFDQRHLLHTTIACKADFHYPLGHLSSPPIRAGIPLRIKALLTIVAIPAYLLATTAYQSLAPFLHKPTEPLPIPRHNFTQTSISAYATVEGPHINSNFPDPAIIHVDGVSYSFATNNRGLGPHGMIHVQMASSTDNVTWTLSEKDALPHVGAWETGTRVWAPDVVQLDDGTFVMYYCDDLKSSPAHHCVGAATAKSVMGPYIPQANPLACPDPHTLGGAIDPDGFLDESTGRRWITYKVDGNSLGHGGSCMNSIQPLMSTPIMLQEVGEDGITLIGDAMQIVDRDAYDGPLIEAPSLYRSHEGIYFLFFSSNCFTGPLYDTSYATASNITGPYTKSARPLFITGDGPNLIGPGGMDIIKGGGMIVFHSHLLPSTVGNGKDRKKNFNMIRVMYSAIAKFDGHVASFA
jgi:beta-xylosidase